MRTAYPRITIRQSMLLVAIVGVLLGAGIMGQRLIRLRRVYQKRASEHDSSEQFARTLLSNVAEMTANYNEAGKQIKEAAKEAKKAVDSALQDPETEKQLREMAKTDPFLKEFVTGESQEEKLLQATMKPLEEFMTVARNEANHHSQLKLKYERAARRPWITVAVGDEVPEIDLMEAYQKAIETSELKARRARPSTLAARARDDRARADNQEVTGWTDQRCHSFKLEIRHLVTVSGAGLPLSQGSRIFFPVSNQWTSQQPEGQHEQARTRSHPRRRGDARILDTRHGPGHQEEARQPSARTRRSRPRSTATR